MKKMAKRIEIMVIGFAISAALILSEQSIRVGLGLILMAAWLAWWVSSDGNVRKAIVRAMFGAAQPIR